MTTWSAIANATTSLGDLKATVTGASGRARSSASLPSGKSYCEVTVNATGGTGFGVGIANTSETNYVGGTANSIGTLQDGNIYTNNSYVTSSKVSEGSPVALATSDVVQIAVDLPNNKIWIAVNGGTWNTYLTGDPAAGTGSMDLSTVTGTKYLYFEGDISGPAVTVNFGLSAFTYTIPTGFSAWDVAAGGVLWRPVSPLILR